MKLCKLLLRLYFAHSVYCGIQLSPRITKHARTRILKVFQDLRGDLYSVESISNVTAAMLRKHKVVKVTADNSIIAHQLTVQEAMDPFILLLSSGQNANPFHRSMSIHSTNNTAVASDPNTYVEINLSETQIVRNFSQWEPLGPCLYNPSRGVATYRQGWSVDTSTGVFANVQFAMLLGLLNSGNMDYAVALGMSGLLSCDVKPGKYVQFQIITDTATVTGVKQRQILATKKIPVSSYFDSLLFGQYNYVKPYTVINSRNVQTACVTDMRYLMCD